MSQLISFKEFRRLIPIIDLAIGNGYKIDKTKGRKWPVLKHDGLGDTIIIINPADASNQGYFNRKNDLDKGVLFQFVKHRLGSLFPVTFDSDIGNINHILYNWLKIDHPVNREYYSVPNKNTFSLPLLQPLNDINYLCSRLLSKETIFCSEFNNRIFNLTSGNHTNTCFPYYNHTGLVIACELRNFEYKMQSAGSNRSNGIWHSNIPSKIKSIILTESPIEAMSFHQLHGEADSLYVAFGGGIALGQIKTLQSLIEISSKEVEIKFVSAFNNDEQGEKYHIKMKDIFPNIIKKSPMGKDFNIDLSEAINSKTIITENEATAFFETKYSSTHNLAFNGLKYARKTRR